MSDQERSGIRPTTGATLVCAPRRARPQEARAERAGRVATRTTASLAALVGAAALAVPPAVAAQEAGAAVAVFEGQGLGHGVGLPLDGANHLAVTAGAGSEEILERFYPETDIGTGGGLVRVLLATRDDVGTGVEVDVPRGAVVRDGRTTPIAPSFPLLVPSGGRLRITHQDDMYRAEVLDERSVTGTVELPPETEEGTGEAGTGEAGTGEEETETDATPAPTDGDARPPPGLAASPHTVWIEPRDGGVVEVAPEGSTEPVGYAGLVEVVVEAERLHVVNELDVEEYLADVTLTTSGDIELAPPALHAAVIAARTYALRAAASEPRVGRFHLYADERSLPYAGRRGRAPEVARAVRETRGQIVHVGGEPIAALVTASAGGRTAAAPEVFGEEAAGLRYLASTSYDTERRFRWRVDADLAALARRLGYDGEPVDLTVARVGDSGRPVVLAIDGSAGSIEIPSERFHDALRLPSTGFQVRVEQRSGSVGAREESPPFQRLPGTPIRDVLPEPVGDDPGGSAGFGMEAGVGAIAAVVLAASAFAVKRMRRKRAARRPADLSFDAHS